MKCPRCQSRRLNVAVAFTGEISCAFRDSHEFDVVDEVALDSRWEDSSPCNCVRCGWDGTVAEARGISRRPRQAPVAVRKPGIAPRELQALKERVQSEGCPARWAIQINRLIAEVERLTEVVDALSHVSPADENVGTSGDTQIW